MSRAPRSWLLPSALLAAALALGGCASSPDAPAVKYKPLTGYTKDPFVPVNLYVNSDEQLRGRDVELTEFVAQRLQDSNAFLRLDRGTQRWAYTLQMRYHVEAGMGPGDLGLRALSLLTLGLVPLHVAQQHVFTVEVFLEPDPVGRLEYSETVRDRISLYDLPDSNAGERRVAEQLLERMLSDLDKKHLLPSARSYKGPPPAATRRKRRDGQSL